MRNQWVNPRLLMLVILIGIILTKVNCTDTINNQTNGKPSNNRTFKNPLCETSKCQKSYSSKVRSSHQSLNKSIVKSLPTSKSSKSNATSIADLHGLEEMMKKHRMKCKANKYKGFQCQKVKWYMWLVSQFDKNVTQLNSWIEIIRNKELSETAILEKSELMPENWYENFVYELLEKYGSPADEFFFHKYKQFAKSRELKLIVPHLFEIGLSPRVHPVVETGRSTPRWFWDPGFNLKLKLPFFQEELKVAISTGPSFLAGIGTGIVLLIIKSIFAPFIFGVKYFLYNIFWKDAHPIDMMKMLWGGTGGWSGPEQSPWESKAPPAAIEQYESPHVHNHYDNGKDHQYGPSGGGGGGSGFGFGYNGGGGYDQKLQFSQLNPILQGLTGPGNNPYKSSLEEGRRNHFKSLLTGPGDDSGDVNSLGGYGMTGGGSESQDNPDLKQESGFNYVPSNGLQAEVENYDPFYSPLLSRIDSIFTHLGYHDEGCRERAVCSIYKFPVKYAPYSNLLSAQLSKHQSELKRPVTSSPKVLRYFKYMKAAKDGQGAANCIDMYPKCTNDTDSVSNLPMITTFNQLTELMGADVTGPG